MSKFAWVTCATNDAYSLGALVLANSLKRVSTVHQLAILITPGVSDSMKNRLKDVYNLVQEVDVMDSKDAENLALLARPELGITFTKLHCWKIVQYEKCVFLDADTLVLQNSDELFEREEFSAAPDVSWPDCFNSGVFVYRPSLDTYGKITEFALKNGSFDGGDQGVLNQYFSDWSHKDITKHLPFIYNTTAFASYCYLPAFKQFRDRIKILHFAGKLKPWLITFNTQTKTAHTPQGYEHATDLIQLWWNIFCDSVHQNLTNDMNIITTIIHDQSTTLQYYKQDIPIIFHDPWEDYYNNMENTKNIDIIDIIQNDLNTTSPNVYNTNTDQIITLLNSEIPNMNNESEIITNDDNFFGLQNNDGSINNNDNNFQQIEYQINTKTLNKDIDFFIQIDNNILNETLEYENFFDNSSVATNYNTDNNINNNYNNNNVNLSQTIIIDNDEVGLAGALASVKLGEPRTVEQEQYEEHMRRECWESGQIDYTGKDSFDNIWKKISQTLETKPTTTEQKDKSSKRLTSSDIQDGKIEINPKTKAKTEYKLIPGGYSVTTTTPEPNGCYKSETKTYYDPVPVTDETDITNSKNTQMDRLTKPKPTSDPNTTVQTRRIPNGREEIYTTIRADGTKSIQVKTFYDEEIIEETTENQTPTQNTTQINKVRKNNQVDKKEQQQTQVKKLTNQESTVQEYSKKTEQTTEETRRVTQTSQFGKSTSTRTDSFEENEIKSITSGKKDIKKKKPKALTGPPVPPEFVDKPGEKTNVVSRKIPNGTEFIYTTMKKDGTQVTSTKTIYEEEEIEMTAEEIREYQKQLKEAEKHKDVKKTISVNTKDGQKKVIPSENSGDVTTVETIKIAGGTEYHYTTITSEGLVKKSSKTVFDPTPVVKQNEDDTDEEEIIEEYEEEVIEPGEKITRTIESVRNLSTREEHREVIEKKKLGQSVHVSEGISIKKKVTKKSKQ